MIESLVRALERPLVVRGEAVRALDAIVVLGAPLRDDKLTPPLVERVEAAADLYKRGGAPVVVASGGVTRGAGRSEADALAEGLRERGVPEVIVEGRSQTTYENAVETAKLLRGPRADHRADPRADQRAGGSSPWRVWLVTQPFHGRRAARLFRGVGFEPHVWHIENSLEYRDRRRALKWVAREYAAWASLFVRGR